MHTKLRHLILSLVIAPAAVALTSCDNDDPEQITYYQDFVSYRGLNAGVTTLDFRRLDDSPLITYTANTTISDPTGQHPKDGQRLVIVYSLGRPGMTYGESGTIDLYQVYSCFQDPIVRLPSAQAVECNAPIYVNTMVRSGHYINIEGLLPYSPKRTITLVLDEGTAAGPVAELYLTTAIPEGQQTGGDAYVAASFDINSLWANPSVSAVKVHVNNSNNSYYDTVTFTK
jgi:lipoprotein